MDRNARKKRDRGSLNFARFRRHAKGSEKFLNSEELSVGGTIELSVEELSIGVKVREPFGHCKTLVRESFGR